MSSYGLKTCIEESKVDPISPSLPTSRDTPLQYSPQFLGETAPLCPILGSRDF